MRKISNYRIILWGGVFLSILSFFLFSGTGGSVVSALATEEGQPVQEEAPPPTVQGEEIVFQGKLYASLKRSVLIPYKGIVTQLLVQAGQRVEAGEPLVRLRLAPEVIASIRRSISPQAQQDIQVRIAQIKGELVPLRTKLLEVEQLAQQKMASGQNLSQVKGEIEALELQRIALQQQLELFQRSAQDDLVALRDTLGQDVSFDHVPEDVTITAPIDGHVLWIHPDIRSGAEMAPGAGLILGVMDPMIIRANIFEIEASRMSIGDKATVSLSSIPDQIFEATLSRISWTPVTPGLGQPSYYEVELTAPNPDFVLKEGYKTQVSLIAAQ